MLTAQAAYNNTEAIQAAFQMITAVHITTHLFSSQTRARNGSLFDYLIVGAGTAGCVLANRLAQDPKITVLLIEAGYDPSIESLYPGTILYTVHSKQDWRYNIKRNNYTFQSQLNSTGTLFLGKMLGGTSSLSIELYQRGQPSDYDGWAALVNDSSWAWDNVLPLFKKSENLKDKGIANSPCRKYHGFGDLFGVSKDPRDSGINNFLAAYKKMGHNILLDVAGHGAFGYGKALLTTDKRFRSSSAYAFLRPEKCNKNLHILRGTMATKILMDSKRRARGIKVITSYNDILIFRARKEVIISAGPVNSPQLLMLSGIGPKRHLEKIGIKPIIDLPVGQNLQDHISVIIVFGFDKDNSCDDEVSLKNNFNPHLYTSPVFVGKVSLNKCNNLDYTTINYLAPSSAILEFCIFYYRYEYDICQNIYNKIKNKRSVFSLVTLPKLRSRGSVTLRSKDPREDPIIDHGYFNDDKDLKNMIRYLKHFIEIRNSTYLKANNAKLSDPTDPRCKGKVGDEFWRCYSLSMMKPMSQLGGTSAMGAVVDSRLRVLGTKGLRVVGGSIMPTITSDDTVVPTVMIAEKAAIMIKEDRI